MHSDELAGVRRGRGSFAPLLIALAATFFLTPLTIGYPVVLMLSVVVLLLAGAVPIFGNRRLLGIFCLSAVLVFSLRCYAHLVGHEHHWLVGLSHLGVAAEFSFLVWIVLARIVGSVRVTRNDVLGAICGYVLLGFVFAFVYAALLDFDHRSIEHSVRGNTLDDLTNIGTGVPELVFYSFTTLTTVGYGDILPRRPLAKSCAMLEAVMGQLYLALLVARLVQALGADPLKEEAGTH